MMQRMLAIWSLIPLPFLKLAGTSGSSQFTLEPGLESFEHYFASVWHECNCEVVWIFCYCLSLGLEWKLTFSSPVATAWVFQICWHIECSTFTASSFSILNGSAGIPSPPLGLFIVMLPKAHLTSHSRMFGSRWVITPSWFWVMNIFFASFLCPKVPPYSWLAYFKFQRVTTLSDMGKQTLEGNKQNLVCTRTQEKGAVSSQETDPDMPMSVQDFLVEEWVSGGLLQGLGALTAAVRAWDLLKEGAIIFITSTMVWSQVKQQGGNTALPINRKLDYRAWPHPSEQDLVSPSVSLSHEEASISLFSLSLRGQTEWKPQSQKTSQTYRMDHSLA